MASNSLTPPTFSPSLDNEMQHANNVLHIPHHDALLDAMLLPNPSPFKNLNSSPTTLNHCETNQADPTNNTTALAMHPVPPTRLDGSSSVSEAVGEAKPRKLRGRPKGSKNKPKEPIFVTQPCLHIHKIHVLEIPNGADIVEMIHNFALAQKAGVIILNGTGRVKNVSVRGHAVHEPTVTQIGIHDISRISGTHVGPAELEQQANALATHGGCYSYFNGSHSYIEVCLRNIRTCYWGGTIMGRLEAAGTVVLNVLTFVNYEFHRLGPISHEVQDQNHPPSTNGVGPSTGGPGPGPSNSPYVNGGRNWDSNVNGHKRPRLSNF